MYRIGQEEIDAVARVIGSRTLFRVNNGLREAQQFEQELAAKVGVKYAICMSGGTAALTCALIGLGIGPGDEVIVPAYTFMATALAVTSVGAIPVLAEVDETMTLDLDDVEQKLRPTVKAVIPVNMVGFPCDMDRLKKLSAEHGFKIVEDACQGDGGSYKGKRNGSIGDVGCYSFNDFKIMTAGEGGAVLTDDRQVYERALIHHDGGAAFRPYKGDIQEPIFMGTQYRISEITGAILRVQLQRLDGMLTDLRKTKKTIMDGLAKAPGIRFTPSHDPEGDCGTTLGMLFESEAKARSFVEKSKVGGWLPYDSGKHVYINWDPLLSKRGACHPAMNPFNMEANKNLRVNYDKDMCPKTLDVLARTVYISIKLDWSEKDIEGIIARCYEAYQALA